VARHKPVLLAGGEVTGYDVAATPAKIPNCPQIQVRESWSPRRHVALDGGEAVAHCPVNMNGLNQICGICREIIR